MAPAGLGNGYISQLRPVPKVTGLQVACLCFACDWREATNENRHKDVMIDKLSGKVAYAIMSFGGFLGVGERYHPLPWNTLKYDTRQGGDVVGLTRQQLEGAPTFARTETPAWGDRL
jgi:PRC-barrel domain